MNKLGKDKMLSRVKRIARNSFFPIAMSLAAFSWGEAQVTDIGFASLPGNRFEVKLSFSEQPPVPDAYAIDNPARLVLDFPGVESALAQKKYALSFDNARDAVVLSDGSRTRLILNLVESVPYDTRIDGNSLVLTVGGSQASSVASNAQKASRMVGESSLSNIDFRRGEDGSGLISIDMSNPNANVDINKAGNRIELTFYQTNLPAELNHRLDVIDFATPVKTIDSTQKGSATSIVIEASGDYDYLAYQADNQYMVSFKPLTKAEVEEQRKKFNYVGDRLSLNFQNIEVRSVLQLIADFTGLNLVASDTVSGSITLRLENVPWDQALDIVLKAKGLDKRQDGNVLMVAPAAEIAEQERLSIETNRQLQELAPLETAFIKIKYANAREVYELFTAKRLQSGSTGSSGGDKSGNATSTILSERGQAIVDERTNTIILTDTAEKIADFRKLIAEVDIPIKQVLIEARIVIATDDFRKELGVRWGLANVQEGAKRGWLSDNALVGIVGNREGQRAGGVYDQFVTGGGDLTLDESLAVDLGVNNPTGSISIGYLARDLFVDMELSAAQSDGLGEIVSQPKVLTGDKQKAVIKSGTEIAYREATSSGAAAVSFKEAVLQLEVTPQITPDNRIIMDLNVSQDSVGAFTPSGEPSIDITQVETQALVGDGQTLVLGGIFHTEQQNQTQKVPLLGDIPYVGRLFRNELHDTSKREILIFITPKIVQDSLLDR